MSPVAQRCQWVANTFSLARLEVHEELRTMLADEEGKYGGKGESKCLREMLGERLRSCLCESRRRGRGRVVRSLECWQLWVQVTANRHHSPFVQRLRLQVTEYTCVSPGSAAH